MICVKCSVSCKGLSMLLVVTMVMIAKGRLSELGSQRPS